MWQFGAAKTEITAFVKGCGMLGYGLYFNTMEGIETPLFARAFVLQQGGKKTALVVCELGFITISLKKGVVKELKRRKHDCGYDDDNLLLMAQHTHSGPGGYSYYGLYNISIPGFVMEIYQKLVQGIADVIEQAEAQLQPGDIHFHSGTFDKDIPVAFNRSILQYNQNPEVTEKITQQTAHLGVNREMQLLLFSDTRGKAIGEINWFGVHTTNISNDNHKLCSDNKGYAAKFLEEQFKEQGNSQFIGAFAQGICGDVTPRFKYNPKRPFQRGKWDGMYEDDFESARFNGRLQMEKAAAIINETRHKGMAIPPDVDYGMLYVNFPDVTCDPEFANDRIDARTGPAAQGMAFFGGAMVDGPGAHPVLVRVGNFLTDIIKVWELSLARFKNEKYRKAVRRKYETQGAKHILMETHARRVLGTKHIDRLILPAWADPSIESIKIFFKKIGYKDKPWTPQILPLQLVILGPIAIAGFPFEITTIAAQRLRLSLEKRLASRGVNTVILAPYANGYSGYVTTNEEYQVQMYEGGHTVFGQWTLAALQTKFDQLAKSMLKPEAERQIVHDNLPPEFTEEELNLYPFYKRNWYLKQERKGRV
ncbi:MAG: neutral/alkaline non-lysosomal ceramidase N-terminal domain-containing protein [Chitinophagales bacterium]